ncbi:MAG TPA: NlpC/P60 family protein [Acidimicrobiia bacterium]
MRRTTAPTVREHSQPRAHRPRRTTTMALTATLLVAVCGPAALSEAHASATSSQTLRQQAQQILNQINANGNRISVLDEQINEADARLSSLHAQIHRTEQQIASAQHTIGSLHGAVVARAAALYEGAGGSTDASQSASSVQQQGAMSVYSQAAAAQDQQRIDKYRNARDARTKAKAALDTAEKAESNQLNSLQSQRHQMVSLNSHEQSLLHQKNAELQTEVVREQNDALKAARAEAASKARAASAGTIDSSIGTAPTGPAPPPSEGAATAVYWARQELGKPYQYGAAGPGTFDCSGLTMFAWSHAGVGMGHNAAGQYSEFPHVAIGDVQPGDLVFFGSPIHHVGIVVGGGQMIEAPETGYDVRYASYFRPDLVGAARP